MISKVFYWVAKVNATFSETRIPYSGTRTQPYRDHLGNPSLVHIFTYQSRGESAEIQSLSEL